MSPIRTVTFAAAAVLIAGSAFAQEPAAAPAAPAAATPEAAPAAPPSAAALAFRPLPTTAAGNLEATLAASGQFTKFLAAAEKTGLTAHLTGTRELTILAPTDLAFDSLPNLEALMAENPAATLQGVLVKHIIGSKITPDQVAGAKGPVPTAGGATVEFDGSVTPMKINESVVLQADVPATNGVIYVIDKVL